MKPQSQLGFHFWSPDEIAETTIGLTSALCRRLWASLKELTNPMSSFECDDRSAYMESRELRNVWDFFTPEEQYAINVHAEIYEDPSELIDRARSFSESWECGTSEGERLVIILALVKAGLIDKDTSAEELEDRHLTLETFADLNQFLTQWEMKLERDGQDLAEWVAGQAKA